MAILYEKLHGRILRLCVRHLPLQRLGSHDRGREHDGHVQRRHEIDLLHFRHFLQVEHQELERIPMPRRQLVHGAPHHDHSVVRSDLGGWGGVAGGGSSTGEEEIVDGVCDQGCGELA